MQWHWWKNLRSKWSKTYISARSGKPTKRSGYITAHGETGFIEMELNAHGTVDWTLGEIAEMTILCAKCSKPIFIGESVVLRTPMNPEFQIPSHAVVHQKQPLELVCCARWECCDSGAEINALWQPDPNVTANKGHAVRQKSLLERMMENPGVEAAIGEIGPDGRVTMKAM